MFSHIIMYTNLLFHKFSLLHFGRIFSNSLWLQKSFCRTCFVGVLALRILNSDIFNGVWGVEAELELIVCVGLFPVNSGTSFAICLSDNSYSEKCSSSPFLIYS